MNIVHTFRDVGDTHKAALCAGAVLAADKGVPNEVRECSGGHLVVADDGKAVRFLRTKEEPNV